MSSVPGFEDVVVFVLAIVLVTAAAAAAAVVLHPDLHVTLNTGDEPGTGVYAVEWCGDDDRSTSPFTGPEPVIEPPYPWVTNPSDDPDCTVLIEFMQVSGTGTNDAGH